MMFGYGRWGKIKEAAKSTILQYNQKLDIGFDNKPVSHLKAYANAFVRSVCENLTFDVKKLEPFLINLIDENVDDPVVAVNSKDWDINLIRQRANLWAKRLRFLHRVKIFKECYDNYYLKKFGRIPSKIFEYSKMMNIIDTSMLLGQRPSIWWTRAHDIDLIVGTFKYGYAQYLDMREDKNLGFMILENMCKYSHFPNADTLTRRLKKLVSLIVRHEQSYKGFNFDTTEHVDAILKEYDSKEIKMFFNFVKNYGVPLGSDRKSNWNDLRDKFYTYNPGFEQKVASVVERLVQHFRMLVQTKIYHKMLPDHNKVDFEESNQRELDFDITLKDAENFFKNDTQLRFIRKKIVLSKIGIFTANRNKLKMENKKLKKGDKGYIEDKNYEAGKHDL